MPSMTIPAVHSFEQIIKRAVEESCQKKPVAALIAPAAKESLRALTEAAGMGLIQPVIIGDKRRISNLAQEARISLESMIQIDAMTLEEAVRTADGMAKAGEIQLMIDGTQVLPELLHELLQEKGSFRSKETVVSHVGVLKPQRYPRLLFLTDGAVIPVPQLRQKIALVKNLHRVANCMGIETPLIAAAAAVEVVYPQMPSTLDAAVLAKMSERGQLGGAIVDGPLSLDVAIDPEAARAKGVTTSAVAGQADGLLVSALEVANAMYHALALFGHCDLGGVIVGGQIPLAVNASHDSIEARVNSIALAVLTAG